MPYFIYIITDNNVAIIIIVVMSLSDRNETFTM